MATVEIIFSRDEEKLIQAYADQCELSVKEAIRKAALDHIKDAVDDPESMEFSDFLTEFGGME